MTKDFIDCLNDSGRVQWFVLLKSMGLSIAPRRSKQKTIETEVKITVEEAEQEMVKVPCFDRSDDDN